MDELDDIKCSIEQMSIDEIAPIVRSSVGDGSAIVEPGWTAETLHGVSIRLRLNGCDDLSAGIWGAPTTHKCE